MDYYGILGIDKKATQGDIKKAFRKQAMKFHPDKNPGNKEAEERFKQINEAYETLSDVDKKNVYDNFGKRGLDPRATNPDYRNPTDIFSDMFGGFDGFFNSRRNNSANQCGSDIHIRVKVSLRDIVFGTEKGINYQVKNICEPCRGTGSEEPLATCSQCGGTGQVQFARGFMNLTATCQTCGGTGKIIKTPCRFCKGRKYSIKKTQSVVSIPKGIRPGQRLKVEGAGNRDRGPNPGHLYVDLEYQENSFDVSNNDIISNTEIDCINAILGCEIIVKTLDGEKIVKIPAGIQDGNRIRLPGLGLPMNINSESRGNFMINVKIVIPKNMSLEVRSMLEKVREKI